MSHPQHTNSYYAATAIGAHPRPVLDENMQVDVAIIGGGFTGLSTALHLAKAGFKPVLLEANRLGWGASGRNGGLVCTGQRKGQDELETLMGKEAAHLLWDISEEAKILQQSLIKDYKIQCDYKSGMLTCAHKKSHIAWLEEEADYMQREYGYDKMRFVDRDELSEMIATESYHAGLLDMGAGHLHPLNYALGLARAAEQEGARLFENSRVNAIETDSKGGNLLKTNGGDVKATYVVIACNGYIEKLDKRLAPKIMPINNFMVATEILGEKKARELIRDDVSIDATKFVVDYYRFSADHRLLFGGGENYSRQFPKDIKSFVQKYMLDVFPQLRDVKLEYGWGGTLAITMNRMPAFGRLEKDIFYALGFSGQGVLLTTMAGKVMADAISGTAKKFDIFESIPTPHFPGGTLLRYPGLVAGMLYYALKDKLGD